MSKTGTYALACVPLVLDSGHMVMCVLLGRFGAVIGSLTAVALAYLGYWFYKRQVEFA